MTAETRAYRLLIKSASLNQLLDELRGGRFDENYRQGIFTYDVPEKPTNLKKRALAPFMRINPIFDNVVAYHDDQPYLREQRIVINFWCETAAQSDKVALLLDEVLEAGGFERYTTNEKPRYKDNDIDLLMNVRKYRIFDWLNEK